MIIGLTGGIGSGKTTVLNLFIKLGFETYVADIEAKNLMNSDAELMQDIVKLFGKDAYKNNELNKAYLAEIVFKDKKKLDIQIFSTDDTISKVVSENGSLIATLAKVNEVKYSCKKIIKDYSK